MRTVRIIEGLDYPEEEREDAPLHHILTCEILARLQQLDEELPGNGRSPGGLRLINRLGSVERRSRRAYRLILDLLSEQLSLSKSYEELGGRRDSSRQSWHQNTKEDISIIKQVWPEVGEAIEAILKRRMDEDGA